MLRCKDNGELYRQTTDGSFASISWTDVPLRDNMSVARMNHEWVVIDSGRLKLASFDTRESARNFIRFAETCA